MLKIEPIKLMRGTHDDTGETGSGCFMNVIAYLNGETQITDRSLCVCPVIRPVAIWLNDFMNGRERYKLVPFIERAMSSATHDIEIMTARAKCAVVMADKMVGYAATIPGTITSFK